MHCSLHPIVRAREAPATMRYILFLYITGARAAEATQLHIGDLQLSQVPHRERSFVKIRGKGDKLRLCPIWPHNADRLKKLIGTRTATESVFLNRCGQPITRFGIQGIVERYAAAVSARIPALLKKRVSTHSIRHYVSLLTRSTDAAGMSNFRGVSALKGAEVY